jgi:hypothetical protein
LHFEGVKKIPGAVVDAGDPEDGPLVLPGEYTLKLTAGKEVATAKVTVVPDPRLRPPAGAVAAETNVPIKKLPAFVANLLQSDELADQHAFALQLRDDIKRLTQTVTQLRTVCKQLQERQALLKDEKSAKSLLDSGKKLVEKIDALEAKLHNPKAKTVYDILAQKGGAKLYSQLAGLYEFTLGSDGSPTQGMRELHADLHKELAALCDQWAALLKSDVNAFNLQAKKLELPGLWVPKDEGASGAK